jgi:hypothetical protein
MTFIASYEYQLTDWQGISNNKHELTNSRITTDTHTQAQQQEDTLKPAVS